MLTVLLVTVCCSLSMADVDVPGYIYWKKQDISSWHEFFPSRVLEEERLTMEAAVAAVQDLATGLNDSLNHVVSFQTQELSTAQLLMQDTEAEGCVNGISNYMQDSIDTEVDAYLDCAADAQAKILRLNTTWAKTKATYLTAYQRALNGIDACAKTYPNKDSINRLKSCVDSMNKNFFSVANTTQYAMFPSPSMAYFQKTVIQCASTAALNVATKGWKFLGMLVDCSKLTSTIDSDAYADELSKWQGYNDTLQNQIGTSQSKNYAQVGTVEQEMQEYYSLQKQSLEQYVVESRGMGFYLNKTYLLLSDYYNTVTASALDNPGEQECVTAAKTALDNVAGSGASESLSCDFAMVNHTKALISDIVDDFLSLNSLMPTIGNVALLRCFSQGYIFAPYTISDCFNLVYASFDINHVERRLHVEADYSVLSGYVYSFFDSSVPPCGDSSLSRLLLGGDQALYNLQRCLYIGSGTTYAVTTPGYVTTTTEYSTATSTLSE